MPAITKEMVMAGPAWDLASRPVSTKIPVPITMPIPKPIRSRAFNRFARWPPSPPSSFWWMTASTSLVRSTPVLRRFVSSSVTAIDRPCRPSQPPSWVPSQPVVPLWRPMDTSAAKTGRHQVGEGAGVVGDHLEVEAGLGDLELAERQGAVGEAHLVHPGIVQP